MSERHTYLASDFLSEVTRRERRTLLGVSMLSIAIVSADLIPKEIAVLGILLTASNSLMLLKLLAVVIGYYLTAFICYGLSDFTVRKSKLLALLQADIQKNMEFRTTSNTRETMSTEETIKIFTAIELEKDLERNGKWFIWLSNSSRYFRISFDLFFPVGFGVLAIYVLLCLGPYSVTVAHKNSEITAPSGSPQKDPANLTKNPSP